MFSKSKLMLWGVFFATSFFLGILSVSPTDAAGPFYAGIYSFNETIAPGGTTNIGWSAMQGTLPYSCSITRSNGTYEKAPWTVTVETPDESFSVSPSSTTSYTINCTDSGGERQSDTVTVTVSDIPTVVLKANPTSLPESGGEVQISWKVGLASSCTASDGDATWRSLSNMHTGGSLVWKLTTSTRFSLECFGSNGASSGKKSIMAIVGQGFSCTGAAPNLSSSYTEVYPGDTDDLSSSLPYLYSESNTSRKCEWHCQAGAVLGQTQTGEPACTVAGGGGNTSNLPVISTSVDKSAIRPGESAVISWTTTNAVSCEIRHTPGGVIGPWEPVAASGSRAVTPAQTGYYDFLCKNSAGQGQLTSAWDGTNQSVLITVSAFPLVTLSANPATTAKATDPSVISWDVQDATAGCTLVEGTVANVGGKPQINGQTLWSGNPTTTKEYTVKPVATTQYTLHCAGHYVPGGGAGWLVPTTVKSVAVTVASSSSLPPGQNPGPGQSPGPGTTNPGPTGPAASNVTVSFGNIVGFSDVNGFLTRILSFLQGFIVTLALIFIVIGGFLYITSAGNDSQMETAKKCILGALIGLALGIAAPAFLKEIYTILGTNTSIPDGVGTTLSVLQIAENVLSFLLTIIGIIAIIMLIVGGIMYLTAAGNEDQIDKGKKIVKYSIIGILIALASLVLVRQVAGFFS